MLVQTRQYIKTYLYTSVALYRGLRNASKKCSKFCIIRHFFPIFCSTLICLENEDTGGHRESHQMLLGGITRRIKLNYNIYMYVDLDAYTS